MKKTILTKEEKDILKSYENGEFESVSNLSREKNKYTTIAKNTFKKNKSITIRLAERDILKVKSKAAEEGIPYQTLITSIIHKHTS
ncbi:MAG TPA: antitoxin [Candidatus Paceibacterota bacterium]|nr:antitoxin [Candidatus Paceibacterota bacterium]HMP19225.1 antitoxin [Candidatus Paceibacterota bacterium]HMP85515.1 antitoxin [Candidatus Paceibacterota bacterium]